MGFPSPGSVTDSSPASGLVLQRGWRCWLSTPVPHVSRVLRELVRLPQLLTCAARRGERMGETGWKEELVEAEGIGGWKAGSSVCKVCSPPWHCTPLTAE